MSQNLVSIIIPAFNAQSSIVKALESVKAQAYSNWEILVINDGGTDQTTQLVLEFSQKLKQSVKLIQHSKSRGPSAARNSGMKAAKGNIIAFLDADDFWTPDHLETLCSALDSGKADLAFAEAYVFRDAPSGEVELLPIDTIEVKNPPRDLLTRNFINTSAAAITRRLMEKIGEFDSSMWAGEELDYWIRAATQGFQIAPTGKRTYYYRKSANSLSAASAKMAEGSARIYEKHRHCGLLPESEILAKARDCYYAAGKLHWRKNPRAASAAFYKAWGLKKHRLIPFMAAIFTRFLTWMPSRVTKAITGCQQKN